jgi:hypothetical protein
VWRDDRYRGMTALLAASTGERLAQLHRLRRHLIDERDVLWVTFDDPQSRSLLQGEQVHHLPYVAPRDWRGVLAGAHQVPRLIRRHGISSAYSTGSGIALAALGSLFLRVGVDPSIQGRTDDYSYVGELVTEDPWLGRGFGTFRPDVYIYLDNQWLLTLLEGGVLGLLALAAVLLGAPVLARGAYHRAPDAAGRSLAQALAGATLALAASAVTFDLLSFPQVALLSFVLFGLAAGLRAVAGREVGT